MSMNINGFRFKQSNLLKIHQELFALRPAIREAQNVLEDKFLATLMVTAIDRAVIGIADALRPYSFAQDERDRRQKRMRETGQRDPAVDYDMSVVILPFRRRVYATTYADNGLGDILLSAGIYEPYGYWDSSDGPEDVSASAWRRRGKLWKDILAQDMFGRPGQIGITFECNHGFRALDIDSILKQVPSIEKRAAGVARERVQRRHAPMIEGEGPEFVMQRYYKVSDYLRTPEGKVELEREQVAMMLVLPQITRELLIEGLPKQEMSL
jgi:hypothetical protein